MIHVPKKIILPIFLFFLIAGLLFFYFLSPKLYRFHQKIIRTVYVEFINDNSLTLSSTFTPLKGSLVQIPYEKLGQGGGGSHFME